MVSSDKISGKKNVIESAEESAYLSRYFMLKCLILARVYLIKLNDEFFPFENGKTRTIPIRTTVVDATRSQ